MADATRPTGSENEVVGLGPLMEASKVIVAAVARSIAELGADVTVPQLRVLIMISARGATNVSTVADGLGVNRSNASRTCDRLVAAGLLTRHEDERDRRNLVLDLSPAGQDLLQSLLAHRRAVLEQVVSRMSASRRRLLDDCMTAFVVAAREVSSGEGLTNGEGPLLHWLA